MKPLFAVVYGPPKRGKTRSVIAGLPSSLFIYSYDGMATVNWLGLDIGKRSAEVPGVVEIIKVVKKYGNKVPSIVIDDFSVASNREIRRLGKKYGKSWDKYTEYNELIYELMDEIHACKAHVAMTCHEAVADEEKHVLGGPSLPGKAIRREFGGFPSFLARVVHDEDTPGVWPYVYNVVPQDPTFEVGNRILDISAPLLAPNLGEIMRLGGYEVPRPKELEWMEDVVQSISEDLEPKLEVEDYEDTLNVWKDKLDKKDPRHVRWVIMDAFDRANLRRTQKELVTDYIESLA